MLRNYNRFTSISSLISKRLNSSSTMTSKLAPLSASKVKISVRPENERNQPIKNEDLIFGKDFTNHMLTVNWDNKQGWHAPEIKPYGNLSLDPSTCVFHYAFELFEGLKAYKSLKNEKDIIMFRPDKNMERMNKSSDRICLPTFESEELIKLIEELIKLDKDMIPKGKGYSLYIRPTMIGTSEGLGVHTPDKAMIFVICSPVGPYYKTGFKAVSLEATDYATRAWPGGVGDKKLGANYAPCIKPQLEAAKRGHQQNLWLFGPNKNITEVGTMNVFFALKNSQTGKKELVTAPLDGTILEGVTRDSVLALCRENLDPAEWEVNERYLSIDEVKERAAKGELIEAFGSGTAAVVSPIKNISYQSEDISVPLQEGKQSGKLTEDVMKWISDIQYGITEKANWTKVF